MQLADLLTSISGVITQNVPDMPVYIAGAAVVGLAVYFGRKLFRIAK